MSDAVIAALSALGTGVLSLVGVYLANRKNTALIAYRLQELEKKQDKHNNALERLIKAEGHIEELRHDVDDLKRRPA
jgi:hypothetical protein